MIDMNTLVMLLITFILDFEKKDNSNPKGKAKTSVKTNNNSVTPKPSKRFKNMFNKSI